MGTREIWESVSHPRVAVIVDIDGVLVKEGGRKVSDDIQRLCSLTPFLPVIASGKSVDYCWILGYQISAKGVFAENGTVYQLFKTADDRVVTADVVSVVKNSDIALLKQALCFRETGHGHAEIEIEGEVSPVLFEPGKAAILTLATLDNCRWTPLELKERIQTLILKHRLRIEVVGPHKDGCLDFQPVDEHGQPYDKRSVPGVIRERFPFVQTIVALIDGDNDLPLASHPDVYPITFKNGSDKVKSIVGRRGLVIEKVGYEGGCLDALYYIRREFLGITHSYKWDQDRWGRVEDPKPVV